MTAKRKPLVVSAKELEFLHEAAKYANRRDHRMGNIPRDHFDRTTLSPYRVHDLCLRLHSYIARYKTEQAEALEENAS